MRCVHGSAARLVAGLLALHDTARLVRRTVSDVPGGERNITGILVAGLSVLSSGMQQIFCRTMQQKHGLASHELLANTAPAQARPGPSLRVSTT